MPILKSIHVLLTSQHNIIKNINVFFDIGILTVFLLSDNKINFNNTFLFVLLSCRTHQGEIFPRLDYLNQPILGWTELFSSFSKWKTSILFFATTFRVSTVFTMVSGWWGMTTISLIWSTTRSHAIAWILEVRITWGLKEKECFYIYFHPTSFHYSYSKMNL